MHTDDLFTDRLSDYLDDELDPAEHAAVERHLAGCAACRTTLAELREVVGRAQSLTDTVPPTDLWPGVASRLDRREPTHGIVHPFRVAARRRLSFTLPQLAAAGIALMLLSGGMVWMARSGDPRADFPPVSAETDAPNVTLANFADPQYDEAVADLEKILSEGRTTLDPETIRVLEDNLRAIDQAIDQSRRALAADPANAYLNSHLARARQRKLALLRRASGIAAGSL
jgi:tetratricopeptide (TPR) repeat protein